MPPWLNPMNLIKLFGVIKSIIDGVVSAYKAYKDWVAKNQQKKQVDDTSDSVKKIDESNKIEDESKRLEEKKKAVCELEKAINPNHKCP